jgi:hypothetical protein
LLIGCGGGGDEGDGYGDGGDGSTSDLVGPEGGTVAIAGAELVIPAGALDEEVEIAIEETADAMPDGFVAASPVFRFEPDGLVFAAPVAARIDFAGPGAELDLIWSTAGADGYQAMGASIEGQSVVADITHFSSGFAGRADGGGGDDCGGGCPVGLVCVAGQCVDQGGDLPACSDGDDNDDDTYTDADDVGCFLPTDESEEIDCNDGVDNDGDGLIDYVAGGVLPAGADPGCTSFSDGSEWPGCSDGFDNDGDGYVDLEDPQCLSADQQLEAAAT